ncbi:DNA polymerase/3'-5' exonuclease PolX [Patescibacteria group bacterium]
MINFELAQIFYRIADFLELKEVEFKPQAYEKAGRAIELLEKDVKDIYKQGGLKALEDISGVGKNIALKIEEYIKTGKIKNYKKLKKECPVDIESLLMIEGLGAKKIKILYRKLKIKNLKDLERVAKKGKIKELEGFGQKSQDNILQGIEFAKAGKGRFLLGSIFPFVKDILNRLEKIPEVESASIAGSIRRMKETIGDGDILVVSRNPEKVMEFFTNLPEVKKVWVKGSTKSSVRFKNGLDCDLRVVKKQSFGAALQYFTGNKDHNIAVRRIAIKKNLKLNEYGVFIRKKSVNEHIAGRTEREVYQALDLSYIEPELRENAGEVEASFVGKLPNLIGYNDIKGDCHIHTDWSDGKNTIEEMAKMAKEIGYKYLAITDHAGFLKISGALDEKRLLRQMREIDKIDKKISGIKILKGCEVDIRKDGSLGINDEVLSKLDIVLASVHSSFKISKKDMTDRLTKAMENVNVDVIAHPTGRVILKREPYQLDFEKILEIAKKTKTALEINAHFARLDLKDTDIRLAVGKNVKLILGTDSHSSSGLSMMKFGIGTARRGWAEKKDILNTKSLKEFLKFLDL